MNRVTLREHVEDAFSKEITREYAKDYLQSIRNLIYRADDRLQNSTLFYILSMIAFEFFSQAIISEVAFGPLKVSNVSIIHKILPVIVAFYFFDAVIQLCDRARLRYLHHLVIETIYKELVDNDLDRYLIRFSSSITYAHRSNIGIVDKVESFLSIIITLMVLMLLPIAFEAYAFTRLFSQYGNNDLYVWISLSISAIFMIQAYLAFASAEIERKSIS